MRSRFLPAAALATLLLVPALAAQSAAAPGAGAFGPAIGPPPPAGATVTHRIFTLAWTDISIPRGVARAPSPAPSGGVPGPARVFTLVWQPSPATATVPLLAAVAPPSCSTTVLVTRSCE